MRKVIVKVLVGLVLAFILAIVDFTITFGGTVYHLGAAVMFAVLILFDRKEFDRKI